MSVLLFSVTIFTSASLLFVVQPLIGRMLLPMLGGSPVVWNTCMVFFQAMLLAGYLYAHQSIRILGIKKQILLHAGLLLIGFWFLPFAIPRDSNPDIDRPVVSLLLLLIGQVAIPFFFVSTTAPLLQRWFGSLDHRFARNPYFLYAASNCGSLLALLAYPILLEPNYSLSEQSLFWQVGYFIFVGLLLLCGLWTLFGRNSEIPTSVESIGATKIQPAWKWVVLGFVPSSLLLAVTSYLTTDIAPIPLLWVIPLALYLITFILAFSGNIRIPFVFLTRLTAILIVAQTLAMLMHATEPIWVLLILHLATFFCGSLICHGWVAQLKPPVEQLTRFYFYLSLGGVLGGIFNTFFAPILFHRLGLIEYPLLLIIISAIRPNRTSPFRASDVAWPLVVAALIGMIWWLLDGLIQIQKPIEQFAQSIGMKREQIIAAFIFGIPLIIVYCFLDRPWRFAFGLSVLFFAGTFIPGPWGETIYLERNSLGIIRVARDETGAFHRMVHGNTIHGVQRIGSNDPLSFYHRTGPVGKLFSRVVDKWDGDREIGVVGLGTGSMASYALPNQDWHFFELDPAVAKIASDDRYFTFLRDCQARQSEILLGDARLKLADFPDQFFDLLVLDAFSSDAIPIHLLTREAFELYLKKLKPEGILFFHISNRTLNLEPVMMRLSESVDPPCESYIFDDKGIDPDEAKNGKSPSVWMMVSRNRRSIIQASRDRLNIPPRYEDAPLWTDDRVNLWPIWKWNRDEE